ncbi:MAG: FAD binding domain-containing protein [Planctomycetes bacterium]|nr:FAD binding domain-containing protein [Planctomycetota bacterium]
MLRLPKFEVATPKSVGEAIALLAEAGPSAVVLAGGTDLLPNLKHELATPELVVSLGAIRELAGIRLADDGTLAIGAMTTLETVASSELVRARAPALAQAASLVAGPQLRTMGTLGGNVLLDTRCQWINQSYFWRSALGFCLKKDGTKCHVVEGGKKCVAAASNDTAPALMTLGASLALEGPSGKRSVALDDFWVADGIYNKKLAHAELLVEVRIPPLPQGHRGAYGKLRERASIDFPLLGIAARLDVGTDQRVAHADVVVTALAAQPRRVKLVAETLRGVPIDEHELAHAENATLETSAFGRAVRSIAELAEKQCHPLPNVPGDADWRQAMVPVFVRRTLLAAARRAGPVHAD